LEKLLVAADQAMYAAKRGGRNRVRSSSGGGTPQDLHAPRSLEISARRGLPMTALIIPANPSRARAIPRDSNAVARISEAIVRSGRLRTTLWLTALSIVVSINCGIVTLLAVGGLHQDGLVLIGMCVTVPSLMVPPIGWFSANLSLEAEAAQRVAETLATTDPLTGLCNRRHFLELADSEFERSRRSRRPLAVLLMDIDHFKSINDTQGHAAGDKVLTHVAQLCRGNTRMQDTTARLGGEEFVVLLPDTPIETAREVAERVRAAVAENTALCQPDGAAIRATVSIGVAVIASNDNSAEHLLERADRAMYAAKDAGRNRVRSSGVPPQHSPVAVCI
jgi:diguanylate cyclase (GGDEF)-like protein